MNDIIIVGFVQILIIIWLLLVTILFMQERNFLGRVFPKIKRNNNDEAITLRQQFSDILKSLDQFSEREKITAKHLQELRKEGLGFIQIVEVERYNPYGDVGGDQSFTVLLLDGKKNGLILTSLHSRAGTRIYVKPVKEGKAEIELSVEEKKIMSKLS